MFVLNKLFIFQTFIHAEKKQFWRKKKKNIVKVYTETKSETANGDRSYA